VTFYTLGGNPVNCSFDVASNNPDAVTHVPFGNGQYFGAMNTADYNTAAVCGACVEVDRLDKGKKVQIMIVDQCPTATNPKCKTGHIDLSQAAFMQIGTAQEGYLGTGNGGATGTISWKYIPCPETGNISFRLKDPTNQYWNQILVMGHSEPIAKLEVYVNGSWQSAVRQSYNYWQVGNGDMGNPPYQVRVTDLEGAVLQASLKLVAGDQPSNAQFPICQ
jgi:expansin (peptidoglycan-binding protein)